MRSGEKKIFAVFSGFEEDGGTTKGYRQDEWLCGLYERERDAKDAVIAFGEGHAFDNSRELQITRYFEKRKDLFHEGRECLTAVKGGYQKWMRYAPFVLRQKGEREK